MHLTAVLQFASVELLMFGIELLETMDTLLSSSLQDIDHSCLAGSTLLSQSPQSSGYIPFNGVVCTIVTCHDGKILQLNIASNVHCIKFNQQHYICNMHTTCDD